MALAEAMVRDLEGHADRLGERRLASIFFGGGTPSLMRPDHVARLIETAHRLFPTGEPVEVTLEANPTDAETARYQAFRDAGVNRLSLGVQSLDDAALRFLGRDHSAEEARRAMAAAQDVFERVSIDLIYARPDQTSAAWRAELSEALTWGAEHVSPYQLTIETGTAFGRAAARGTLIPPDEDSQETLFDVTQAVLSEAGFEAYEVSNHARGTAARSAHNLNIWRGMDYVGVGPGAHGRLTLEGARTATVGERGVAAYVGRIDREGLGWAESDSLSPLEAAEERAMLGLRTSEGVALADLKPLAIDQRLTTLVSEGLLLTAHGRLSTTARGRKLLDGVVRALLV